MRSQDMEWLRSQALYWLRIADGRLSHHFTNYAMDVWCTDHWHEVCNGTREYCVGAADHFEGRDGARCRVVVVHPPSPLPEAPDMRFPVYPDEECGDLPTDVPWTFKS